MRVRFYLVLVILVVIANLSAKEFNTFEDFQNHIKNESYRVMNSDLHNQIKAERADRDYGIGDTKNFWRWDFSNMPPEWEQSNATCRAVGEHCYLFVSDDQWDINMDQNDVDTVMDYLENTTMNGDDFGAIEMDINLFGSIPDELDNDEKIIVYYSALGSFQGSSFDGYFSSYNEVTEAEAQTMNPTGHSNECEMIYMTCSPLDPTEPVRISVLSHELQHMIHWSADTNETTWVDEGMAELAMVHFGMPDPLTAFYSNANYQLNFWDQQWKDYIKVLLFFTYIDEHFVGENLISDIVSEPLNGLDGISNQLEAHNFTISMEELFTNWAIANYLDETDISDGLYGYEALELPNFNHHHLHSTFPTNQAGSIQPWATKYVKIFHDEDVTVEIEMDNTIILGIIKKGEDVSSEVEKITVSENGTITLPQLEAPFTNHVLVFANSNDESLTYSYNIGEVSINNDANSYSNIAINNYPNPFNPSTTISFSSDSFNDDEQIQIEIYNLKGQIIKQFSHVNVDQKKGSVVWNGDDENGNIVGSGVYFYRINSANFSSKTQKMILIK